MVTDHNALVWLQTAKHTGRLERWALKLQEFNFQIIHRPGKSTCNCVADALSRREYPNEVGKAVINSIGIQTTVDSSSSGAVSPAKAPHIEEQPTRIKSVGMQTTTEVSTDTDITLDQNQVSTQFKSADEILNVEVEEQIEKEDNCCIKVTFAYASEIPTVMPLLVESDEDEEPPLPEKNIGELQENCPDFQHI